MGRRLVSRAFRVGVQGAATDLDRAYDHLLRTNVITAVQDTHVVTLADLAPEGSFDTVRCTWTSAPGSSGSRRARPVVGGEGHQRAMVLT
jgi:hypothetical protein